ncbi:hypothetical protein COB55_00185 [Candidatus Wolfebacteria bacterium]|nr:MAG: hypothetical protein COB55_00185 [Candidatus Wolfebacteria bacterium]
MKKILLIGEGCKDIFVYCGANRLAPDLPIPVLNIIEQKENPGMVKNVERNINNIIDNCDVITNENWQDVTKTRYMHHGSNHAFLRVDTDHNIKRIDVKKIPFDYDIIAISDYNKGFLIEEDIKYICENNDTVFIDTKKVLGDWAKKAKFIKINNYEYERSLGSITDDIEKKIICTKGGGGATFMGELYPVADRVEVKDTSGAGDSFFAALLAKYIETEDIKSSIKFANECASEVVKHKGVSVIRKTL